MERLTEEQLVMSERFAALEKEATTLEVEAMESQAAVLSAVTENNQQAGVCSPAVQVLDGQRASMTYPLQHTLQLRVVASSSNTLCNMVMMTTKPLDYSSIYIAL